MSVMDSRIMADVQAEFIGWVIFVASSPISSALQMARSKYSVIKNPYEL